jgi:hypothetical protein
VELVDCLLNSSIVVFWHVFECLEELSASASLARYLLLSLCRLSLLCLRQLSILVVINLQQHNIGHFFLVPRSR